MQWMKQTEKFLPQVNHKAHTEADMVLIRHKSAYVST